MQQHYKFLNDPAILNRCVEVSSYLIYLGDTIKVSNRWAGENKNPLEGKTGEVVAVRHGLQSHFNREYACVFFEKGSKAMSMWAYTLDVTKRGTEVSKKILDQFGKYIYLDDIVLVKFGKTKNKMGNSVGEPNAGKYGRIDGLILKDRQIVFELTDIEALKELSKLEHYIAKQINVASKKERDYIDFATRFAEKNPAVYLELERTQQLRGAYETMARDVLRKTFEKLLRTDKKYKKLAKELERLRENCRSFFVPANRLTLIERFPPNDLYMLK